MHRHIVRGLLLACPAALVACADPQKQGNSGDAGATAPLAPIPYDASRPVMDASTRGAPDGRTGVVSCARAHVGISRLVPTVQVVVDASGSMAEPLGSCGTRWSCLREALIGTTGLITELQKNVSFGLTLYGGQIAKIENGVITEVINGTCPRIVHVPPALSNRDAIAAPYEIANPGGGTPTAEALAQVIDSLPTHDQIDAHDGPQVIVLVTDGDPNVCTDPVNTAYGPTEAQALRAQQRDIQLFALTVADDQNRGHLQRMANLGAGLPADATPGAPFFEPGGRDELAEALRSIIDSAVPCDVKLDGMVTVSRAGEECQGSVKLNGRDLPCNSADGWRLSAPDMLTLEGAACSRFKENPSSTLDADFPCDLVILR